MQIELLNRKRWKTRIELANAIFEYIEIFHNRQRRHSGLEYRTPIEFELAYENPSIPASDSLPAGDQTVGQVTKSTRLAAVPSTSRCFSRHKVDVHEFES
jgi:hypothetical protein